MKYADTECYNRVGALLWHSDNFADVAVSWSDAAALARTGALAYFSLRQGTPPLFSEKQL